MRPSLTPKISIIIPVYNGSNFLAEAIDSALAQTYKNVEILVINDGSNDNGATEAIAKSYGSKIVYLKKENGGVATALNLGIEKMTGDYFSWLSHDDLYKVDRLQKMLEAVTSKKDLRHTVIASSYIYFDEAGEYPPAVHAGKSPNHPLAYLLMGYINGCSLLIPKELIARTGLFNKKLPTTQDFDYWFRLLRTDCDIVYVPEVLTMSRSHTGQGSKALIDSHVKECDELWTWIMETLSRDEKQKIFGSEEDFFVAVRSFLSANTLYHHATQYARHKELEIKAERFQSEP